MRRPRGLPPSAPTGTAAEATVVEAFRLLDAAAARLVQSRGHAEYALSVTCQAGVLQECWLSAGRLGWGRRGATPRPPVRSPAKAGVLGGCGWRPGGRGPGAPPAVPSASDTAVAVKRGEYGRSTPGSTRRHCRG